MNKISLMLGLSALVFGSSPSMGSSASDAPRCPSISSQDLASLAHKASVIVDGTHLLPFDGHAAQNIKAAASGLGERRFEPIHAAPQTEDYRHTCKYKVNSNGISEVWMFARSADEWSKFHDTFADAFHRGDIDKLNELKESHRSKGFYNINDLGGEFMKYGSGTEKWDMLLADAAKNKK